MQDVTCGLVDTCTESEIHSVVDAMVLQQMPSLGYKYVFLDDCEGTGQAVPQASAEVPVLPLGIAPQIHKACQCCAGRHALSFEQSAFRVVSTLSRGRARYAPAHVCPRCPDLAGWASTERDAEGNIQPDASQFPSGIPSLREYVDKAEMELGLYTCAGEYPARRRWQGAGRCWKVEKPPQLRPKLAVVSHKARAVKPPCHPRRIAVRLLQSPLCPPLPPLGPSCPPPCRPYHLPLEPYRVRRPLCPRRPHICAVGDRLRQGGQLSSPPRAAPGVLRQPQPRPQHQRPGYELQPVRVGRGRRLEVGYQHRPGERRDVRPRGTFMESSLFRCCPGAPSIRGWVPAQSPPGKELLRAQLIAHCPTWPCYRRRTLPTPPLPPPPPGSLPKTYCSQSFRVGPDHLPVWSFPALQQERRLWQSQLEGLPVSALQAAHPSLSARELAAEEAKRADRLAWDSRMKAAGRKGGLTASLASLESRYASGLGQGTSDIIEHMAVVANSTSAYGKADPDFAETMLWFLTPFTDSQTEWSFWCLWGGNLLFATDTRFMSAEKSSIVLNAEAIDVHQDPTAAPGSRRSIAANKVQLWARDMSDSDVTVILFNPTETNQTASLQWADVGISGTPSSVRDLWQHANLQPNMAGFARELEPHQVAMLRLSR